jgi:Uma2 family endonuclease
LRRVDRISTFRVGKGSFFAVSTILDIPGVRERISRLSVEEYHRLDEYNENGRRTELIRGIVIEKMSKSPLHSALAKRLYDLLARILPSHFVLRREDPLTLVDSEPEPDVAVVEGKEADYFHAHPSTANLVIEVAVSSAALDRENASLYAEAGVKEYWIVLGEAQEIEVYRQLVSGRYLQKRVYGLRESIECTAVPQIRLPVAEVFAR